jgi:hypothetical protein
MIGVIPLNTPQVFVDAYKNADIAGDVGAKRTLLQGIGAKCFIIFKSYDGDGYEKDDRRLIADYMTTHKIMYGYNSVNYDSIMLDILMANMKYFNAKGYNRDGVHITQWMHDHSDKCVHYGKDYRRNLAFYKYYKRTWTDRDIQKILYLDKSFTGLKKIAINLRWYRIQELPYPPDHYLTTKEMWQVADYNVNDILITRALIKDQAGELEIRDIGSKEFDLDLTNKSRSSIGKSLVIKYYNEITGIDVKDFIDLRTERYKIRARDVIDPRINFRTAQFNKLFTDVRNSVITIGSTDKWGFSLLYNGTKYIIAKGGLHSKDDPKIYDIQDKPNTIMRDADVVSYYPNIILNLRVHPKHLVAHAFLGIVKFIMDSRIRAKHEYSKVEDPTLSAQLKKKAEIYKIAINRIYGAFKDSFDFEYDPECTYKTTINGQLYLLMLIEELELNGIHVISANTDGIVSYFDKSLEPKYNEICTKWQKDLNYELEFTDYERYVRFNVNEYIAIKKGFYDALYIKSLTCDDVAKLRAEVEKKYVKQKGLFISNPDFTKGFINPVVSIALNAHYIYGDQIIDTLRAHANKPRGVYDFKATQKVDKKFEVQYHHIEMGYLVKDVLQQYNRFYVSKRSTGNILKYNPNATKAKYTSIIAGHNLQLVNFYDEKPVDDIDFSYYGKECYKIIHGDKKKSGISTLSLDFEYADDTPDLIEADAGDYSYLYDLSDD